MADEDQVPGLETKKKKKKIFIAFIHCLNAELQKHYISCNMSNITVEDLTHAGHTLILGNILKR